MKHFIWRGYHLIVLAVLWLLFTVVAFWLIPTSGV